jgi:hypothetical protein
MVLQALISFEKAQSLEIRNSHFDQPSPTSVLDALFEDTNEKSASSSESAITAKQGKSLLCGVNHQKEFYFCQSGMLTVPLHDNHYWYHYGCYCGHKVRL